MKNTMQSLTSDLYRNMGWSDPIQETCLSCQKPLEPNEQLRVLPNGITIHEECFQAVPRAEQKQIVSENGGVV